MWCFVHCIWLGSKFILWRGQKRRHELDTCEKSKQEIMTNSSLSRLQTHKSDQKHKIPSTFKCVLSQKRRKGESQSDSPLQQRLNYLRLHSNPQAFDTSLRLLCDHGRPNRFFSFFLHALNQRCNTFLHKRLPRATSDLWCHSTCFLHLQEAVKDISPTR